MLTAKSFRQIVYSADWYQPGLKILCACSGGIDSTVLLHLLSKISDIEISIIHLNHELRGESSNSDMNFVLKLGHQYKYPVHLRTENIKEYARAKHLSIEEAGSQRRRTLFHETLKLLDYDVVITGQHQNDQIETILINLITGTGIRGLTGIAANRSGIVRPLLNISRSEIEDYAHLNGLEYCVDQSNTDTHYLRNNVRTKLIPLISELDDTNYTSIFQDIVDQGHALNGMLEKAMEHTDNINISSLSVTKISLGMDDLPDYFSPIQKAIFDRAFQTTTSKDQGMSEIHFRELKTLMTVDSIGKEIQLPAAVTAYRDRKNITFILGASFDWDRIEFSIIDDITFPFFRIDSQELEVEIFVRNPSHFWYKDSAQDYLLRMRENGDRMVIDELGNDLSVNQILQEAHIAPSLKRFYPVLVLNEEIVWVPGIRTSYSALIDTDKIKKSEVRNCIKVEFDEGTFE